MHTFLAAVLVLFAGWTLAAQFVVYAGGSLHALLAAAPPCVCAVAIAYVLLARRAIVRCAAVGPEDRSRAPAGAGFPATIAPLAVCLAPAVLFLSWVGFWLAAVLILVYCVTRKGTADEPASCETARVRRWEWIAVLCLAIAAATLTLAVSRPDLDDAFYVASAAFTSGHPTAPLLASDTMHGERSWPFINPTYRLATFELLAGAVAHVIHIPAMDVMYRVFPPFWAVVVVV